MRPPGFALPVRNCAIAMALPAAGALSMPGGSAAPFMLGEQARLTIALGGVALAGWPVILVQLEQGWLFGAGLGLRLAQGDEIAPEIAAAIEIALRDI